MYVCTHGRGTTSQWKKICRGGDIVEEVSTRGPRLDDLSSCHRPLCTSTREGMADLCRSGTNECGKGKDDEGQAVEDSTYLALMIISCLLLLKDKRPFLT